MRHGGAGIEKAQSQLTAVAGYQDRLSEGPVVLADCLDEIEALIQTVGKVFIYAHLFHEVDNGRF